MSWLHIFSRMGKPNNTVYPPFLQSKREKHNHLLTSKIIDFSTTTLTALTKCALALQKGEAELLFRGGLLKRETPAIVHSRFPAIRHFNVLPSLGFFIYVWVVCSLKCTLHRIFHI